MNIDLGTADAAVGISFSVITDFLRELTRLGRLPRATARVLKKRHLKII